MKRENTSFFASLFRPKQAAPVEEKASSVIITAYSQPHVLQQRMKEEHLSHGETVTANLSPVRLEYDHGRMVLYFCPMKSIEILETIAEGDGGSIPPMAKIEGLSVPGNLKSGFYKLRNVKLTSNGTMQVIATEKTEWEYA
jgi:hypothetical protein